jgi:hypothetical protein
MKELIKKLVKRVITFLVKAKYVFKYLYENITDTMEIYIREAGIVSYDNAIALKNVGFSIKTYYFYRPKKEKEYLPEHYYGAYYKANYNKFGCRISAPTYFEVISFFSKHNISIEIIQAYNNIHAGYSYAYKVQFIDKILQQSTDLIFNDGYNSYEEAFEKCIAGAINMYKNHYQ